MEMIRIGINNYNDMKKNKKVLVYIPFLVSMLWYLSSCSKQNDMFDVTEGCSTKTCVLAFNVSRDDFDESKTRTTASTVWNDGDKVYLTFEGNAYGVATFQAGQWLVEYFGYLKKNKKGVCKAVYFRNSKSREEFQAVNLTHETAIYEDLLATCYYDGSLLTITANLQPKTGRLRFKGESGDTIKVHGITYNTRYSVFKGEYEQSSLFIELVTQKDGYTPYLHGTFLDSVKCRLNVATSKSAYSRVFADSVMQSGASGWLSIPKEDFCSEWKNKMIFRVKTTEFAMIPVSENGTLSFLIGETEVTKGLYNALTDTVIVESNYPQTFTETSILDSLKKVLDIDFKIPTRSQWQWAYKGGDKSQGYIYSGSNTVSDVAWYSGNSEGKAHEVSTLIPNELGIYDMAGNLTERSADYYDYGGNYSSTASGVTSTSYKYSSTNYGLRLTISF